MSYIGHSKYEFKKVENSFLEDYYYTRNTTDASYKKCNGYFCKQICL